MSKSFFKSFTESKEVKNAGWLIVGKVAQMALSLVVSILTARYLGPGGYGLINYGMAFVGFFTAIASLGINSIIVKEFVDSPNEQGKTTGSAMLMRLCSGFLSALMIVGVSVILDHTEPKTILIVSLCGISLIFQAFETINYWFQSRYQSKVTAIITLIAYAVTSIYKIILLILGKDVLFKNI